MLCRSLAANFVAVFALLIGGDVIRPATVEAGGGCHKPDRSVYTEGPATVIRMDVCSFGPTIARVPIGATVRFLNTAPNEHLVIGRAGAWGSDILAPQAEFSQRFGEAGVYPYSCPLHPGMVGAVVVGDSSEVAAPAVVTGNESPASEPVAAAQPAPPALALVASATSGGMVGLMIGAFASRRARTPTTPDTIRNAPAIDR